MSDDLNENDDEFTDGGSAGEGATDDAGSSADAASDAAPDDGPGVYDEPEAGDEMTAADDDYAAPQMKLCVYCLAAIDSMSTRCNHCAGFLPPAEGTDFKQHWTMMFCCVSIFVACIWLPIEGARNDLYASHSIAGGFLTVFAAYGMLVGWVNIFHKKMILWPALFMALDGLYVSIRRLLQLIEQMQGLEVAATRQEWARVAGPGLWVILFCSLLVFWTLLRGAASGRKKDQERKDAARAARKR